MKIPQLQKLLQLICKHGWEHHVAVNRSHYGRAVVEALRITRAGRSIITRLMAAEGVGRTAVFAVRGFSQKGHRSLTNGRTPAAQDTARLNTPA